MLGVSSAHYSRQATRTLVASVEKDDARCLAPRIIFDQTTGIRG